MSRSKKKHPVYKAKMSGGKKAAARAFRHYKDDIPTNSKKFFRRVYNSYNVWDNWWLYSAQTEEQKRFKHILNELLMNGIDKHLTEEEAYAMLDELKDLKDCFWLHK